MSFFEELKRRNVIRVAIAYGVAAWFILQLADVVLENIGAPRVGDASGHAGSGCRFAIGGDICLGI